MTRVVVIGGFLGAGKTTLMLATARRLAAQGKRVCVVTNDQAPEMVDTRLVRRAKFSVAEISGGCICCRFSEFTAEIGRMMRSHRPDVLLVEPVGSCVDLAATVLRPLLQQLSELSVAPLTAVVDPGAWLHVAQGRALPRETAYIYRKQMAEADIILLNKSDITSRRTMSIVRAGIEARVPRARIFSASAQTGQGMDRWCSHVLGSTGSGKRIRVNYDTYAKGEQALGWLNAVVALEAEKATAWSRALPEFIRSLCHSLNVAPTHLKCLLTSEAFVAVANVTSSSMEPAVRVLAAGRGGTRAELIVNLRTALPPRVLRPALMATLERMKGVRGTIVTECSFAPARPVPEYRIG
jgi:Ni2+-binding GTPase involved in maturation of urease and hydrogenase